MEIVVSKLLLLIFFLSLTFVLYYVARLVYLFIGIKNDTITQSNIVQIKEDIFESTKLKVLWFSLSYLLFYIFL
jgi:hypothetical protein